jgi:hypothetical protein
MLPATVPGWGAYQAFDAQESLLARYPNQVIARLAPQLVAAASTRA